MKTCMICNKEYRDLTKHIKMAHKLTKDAAYDLMLQHFPELFASCTVCEGKIKKTVGAGGKMTCSQECSKLAKSNVNRERKQSTDVINRRILNTDQTKKQAARKKTMLERYGSLYAPKDAVARNNKLRGQKRPRSVEHQTNIIDSKRKNGTLKHTELAKENIRKGVNKVYQSDNPPCTISSGSPKGYITGTINEIYYRSSYELKFLKYCHSNNIDVKSASTTEFRVRYVTDDGKQHYYYPDFYLPDYDCIIEIKPLDMITDLVHTKSHACALEYNFSLVTEEELNDLSAFFKKL